MRVCHTEGMGNSSTVTEYQVRVYHSTDRGFMFDPWVKEAPLQLVDEFKLANDGRYGPGEEGVLDQVFDLHQTVRGTERNCQLRIRSLSVGDVVRLGDRAWACDRVGWREISVYDLNVEEA